VRGEFGEVSIFWLIFTAIDLYVGVIAVDLMKGSVPPEKLARLAVVKKILIAATLIVVAMIVVKWVRW
jgi:hypothetical protein